MWCMNPWSPAVTHFLRQNSGLDGCERERGGGLSDDQHSFVLLWPETAVASFWWFSGCEILEYLILFSLFVFKIFQPPKKKTNIDKPSTSCLLPVPKLQILQPYQFLLLQKAGALKHQLPFRLGSETIYIWSQFRFIPSFPTDFRLVFLDLFLFHPVQINHTMPRSSHPLGPTKMFETWQQEHRSLQSYLIRFAELNQWSWLNS